MSENEMTLVEVAEALARKGVVPGETECCFLRNGRMSSPCTDVATAAVVERRKTKNVVMPGCRACAAAQADDDKRFRVVTFARLSAEELL